MMAGLLFVGVTTGSSLVHRARPAWQPLLGQACRLRGVDIPLGADDETYLRLPAPGCRSTTAGSCSAPAGRRR
jgi:hypothetical protein